MNTKLSIEMNKTTTWFSVWDMIPVLVKLSILTPISFHRKLNMANNIIGAYNDNKRR